MQKETQTCCKTLLSHTRTHSIPACKAPVATPHQICSGLFKPSHSGSFIHFLQGFLQLQSIISL